MTIEIKLKNFDAISNKLKNLETAMQGQAVDSALFSASRIMAEEAKQQVKFKTGRLYTGITRKRLRINEAGQVARMGITVRNRRGFKYVGSRWHLEEFGFRHRRKPVQPYFGPAFDKTKKAVVNEFVKRLQANIKKAQRGNLRISKSWSPGPEENDN